MGIIRIVQGYHNIYDTIDYTQYYLYSRTIIL